MTLPSPLPVRRARRNFFLAMAALTLGALGLTASLGLRHRAEALGVASDRAALYARAFEDHLSQSFNVIELTLDRVADLDTAHLTAAEASKALAAELNRAPYF